jgi:tRNA(His) guanylyltransferase
MDGATGKDDLGDRMKGYECVETARTFDASLPLVARLDGRAFSTFTRGMEKPFDAALSNLMREVTAYLIEKNHATIGYTQSDEITLIFDACEGETQPLFGGRCFKIASVLAGMASAKFALLANEHWPERIARNVPQFDCRAFNVPSRVEAVNCLIWRENDASRNAIQMVAQSRFSPKQLHGKSCDDLEVMLRAIGVEMTDYEARHRFGTYLARRNVEVTLTGDELARIPEMHRPTGPVVRSRILEQGFAPLRNHADRVAMIFGTTPEAPPHG